LRLKVGRPSPNTRPASDPAVSDASPKTPAESPKITSGGPSHFSDVSTQPKKDPLALDLSKIDLGFKLPGWLTEGTSKLLLLCKKVLNPFKKNERFDLNISTKGITPNSIDSNYKIDKNSNLELKVPLGSGPNKEVTLGYTIYK
jgi:hypothetical protein